MLSQSTNRVQAIKSKFENLNVDNDRLVTRKRTEHLCKQNIVCDSSKNDFKNNKENSDSVAENYDIESDNSNDGWEPKPNLSYLYSKSEVKRTVSDSKKSLTRQTSDPGKKLHRSHAFRCDRSQKIVQSPKRHGSCNGRSETSDFTLKMEKKLSKERLKQLGNLLEGQMKKENYVPLKENIVGQVVTVNCDSIPDSDIPKHILDQYAKVVKVKKSDKQDAMTDSGVSSETENTEDDRSNKVKKLLSQFEKSESVESNSKSNLQCMDDLGISSETMKLERKNPHVTLTDTLKKALKQPLPPGPPPKKPPRVFALPPTREMPEPKKDAKKMLEKLEKVLQKREEQKSNDIVKTIEKKPKEIHYLCTEILDISHKTLVPDQNVTDTISNCLNSLNCAIVKNSTTSLPYTRFSTVNENSVKLCCSCSNDELERDSRRLSTFLNERSHLCPKCLSNEKSDGFKCHLHCKCRTEKSAFFLDKEHIYDEPYAGSGKSMERSHYGTLRNHSKSLEDLRSIEDQKIYDIPCDISRPATPDMTRPVSEFERLRQNFESGFKNTEKMLIDTKLVNDKPKPVTFNLIPSKSTENLTEGFKSARTSIEKKFATESKRYQKNSRNTVGFSLPKNTSQQDVDRENLNRLMNEIYETVSAACKMEDNKPGSFPTSQSDSTSEDSVKLTRSLTEKRKNYVRRVSSRVAYLDSKVKTRYRHQTSICSYKSEVVENPYSTFRSWKSFRTSRNNLTNNMDSKCNLIDNSGMTVKNVFDSTDGVDKLSIDEKTGCVDIDLQFERYNGLFNVCLLVGLNYMTGQAYVKSVFPSQVQVPPHIENLIFPETLSPESRGEWSAEAKGAQCYSLVLTDERGERSYGYCRRVLPEGATTCLPLCYCLIGRFRAPGFYYKVLQEIESHHGSSEIEINTILQQLFDADFPNPGEELTITYTRNNDLKRIYRNSVNLGDILKCKTMPDMRRNDRQTLGVDGVRLVSNGVNLVTDEKEVVSESDLPNFYDLENNNTKKIMFTPEGPRTRILKRPIEPRIDEDNLSILLDSFGAGLVIKVFGSLLLERKVIIVSDQLSLVSSCLEALQTSIYPFVWQQPLISTIPSEIQREVLEAPLPILAGMLSTEEDYTDIQFEEGMLIDLTKPSKVLFYQGDESTILPTSSYKTLKTSLQMESVKNKENDTKTRNVLISEAFLRFFVDILGDFWRFFSIGEVKEGDLGKNGVVFDRESFIKSSSSKQNQYFLEWFTETAMFNHFIQNMAACHTKTSTDNLVDTPLPNFYELFEERVKRDKSNAQKYEGKSNYKSVVNKKVRLLKTKLRELVT